ncbi:hypothetical protein Q7C_1575 [Methylophaga frappieri]|jgi:hypothetical protein|uniref:Uncharacterized protein n=1 Tax=Methylophaga frappieri (strain ATCC BAA-2434 / DSM 25690 / JAM7) TaxID=754477 RepID=I1YII1_METFJ|nr:hypothetical protein [Methylophaga frappieri]AFJ02724.1 hypothetical protein Q7C_1575 [Methylophaga frappieri]
MITFENQHDGFLDMDCTQEEFDAIRIMISHALAHYDKTDLFYANIDRKDVEGLKKELDMFHDLPLPLEEKYFFRLLAVMDSAHSFIIPEISEARKKDINRQIQAVSIDKLFNKL